MRRIRCKDDFTHLIDCLKREGDDVSGTYEFTGTSCMFQGTTEDVKDIFKITDEFERDFIEAISKFIDLDIGPYHTPAYFLLIPGVKNALKHMKFDCLDSRRCVITFPEEHCFQSIQFLVRENSVNVVCFMRSCDVIKNLPWDIWICSKLADIFSKYLEDTVGVHPYPYHKITMMFGSLHVFKEDLENVL